MFSIDRYGSLHCCAIFEVPVMGDGSMDVANMRLFVTYIEHQRLETPMRVEWEVVPGGKYFREEKVIKFSVNGWEFMETFSFFFWDCSPIQFIGLPPGKTAYHQAKRRLRRQLKEFFGLKGKIAAH